MTLQRKTGPAAPTTSSKTPNGATAQTLKKINGEHPFLAMKTARTSTPTKYKGLIYGPSRSGKTHLLGTAAYDERLAPVIVLAFEGGALTLDGIPSDKLEVFPIENWTDFNVAHDYLANEKHPYKTVGVDSISEVHVFTLLGVVDHELAVNDKRSERGDQNTIEQSDYGKAMVMLRRFIRSVLQLDMHCIFTALPKSTTVAREGMVQLPNMFGAMAEEIVGMFDISAYLTKDRTAPVKQGEAEKVVRRLILQNTPGIRAGVRTAWGQQIPDTIIDPTMTKLLDALQRKGG